MGWRKQGGVGEKCGGLEKKKEGGGGVGEIQGDLEKKQGGLEKYLHTYAHMSRLKSLSQHVVHQARSLRHVLHVETRTDWRVACCAFGSYSGAIGGVGQPWA